MKCQSTSSPFKKIMETKRRSLLQKYDIPISHLDFGYIENCKNTKELERILAILWSGEEGHFPDLTKFAEDKLRKLKPESKALRTEELLPTKSCLGAEEWKEANEPFIEWTNEIKVKDKFLSTISESSEEKPLPIPPVRQNTKKIEIGKKDQDVSGRKVEEINPPKNRIKSTDYKQWDKYDADTEILKMDLEEERIQEEVERKNRINIQKSQKKSSTSEMRDIDDKAILNNLTNVEKENLATRFKERGNDYFKAQEFENAINEYTQCLKILPSAAGFNNRAVAYLKLMQYTKCIEDCDRCLQIEPKNVKALLRKAQAFLGLDKRDKAYEVYTQVIAIEPSNVTARYNLNDLKCQISFPPSGATRIKIQDEVCIHQVTKEQKKPSQSKPEQSELKEKPKSHEHKKKSPTSRITEKEEDLSKLIVPNKIVKSKLASAVQTLEQLKKENKSKPIKQQEQNNPGKCNQDIKLFDDQIDPKKSNLIEEI